MRQQGPHRGAWQLAFELHNRWHLPAGVGQPMGELVAGVARAGVERRAPPWQMRDTPRHLEVTALQRTLQHRIGHRRGRGRRTDGSPERLERHARIEWMLRMIASQ